MTARIRDAFPHPIREIEHAWIPLSDGTRLSARLWLPQEAEAAPVPAILEYIPYCKRDGTAARDEAMHPYFAGHGYAAVRVDMRGSGESEGLLQDEYLLQEQEDALEVIAWIADQAWCNGRVGMMGKSWGGFNALQVAARRPPALQAIISVYSTDDRYADDIHYMGGCLLTENPNWSFAMFPANARPPDPALVGEDWRALWLQRMAETRPWIIDWLHHQQRDDYWRHGSVCEDYGAIQCPVFLIGGWADPYSNSVPRLLAGLSAPCKALIGPWGHQYPHQAVPGPKAGFLQEALAWWDHWLKDADNSIMEEPRYRVWMQDSVPPRAHYAERPGAWVAEETWPSPHIEARSLALSESGLAEAPGPERSWRLRCPQTTGLCTPIWGNNGDDSPECPLDQRGDDALSLCFDTEPLEADLAILGAPVASLEVSVDQPSAFLSLRLCEVMADGASTRVTYGLLNLTHREGHERAAPLEPGRRYKVRVQLNDIAHRFSAGNRLRLSIATAMWPVAWPSPRPVTLTLYSGESRLELPVRRPRPEDGELRPIPPAEQSRVRARSPLRVADPPVLRIERDVGRDSVTFVHVEDAGRTRIDDHGWVFGGSTWRRYSIRPDDPTSARMELRGVREYGRAEGPQVLIEVSQLMTCDAEAFQIHATLVVSEEGTPVLSRRWLERIPRQGV